MILPQRLDCHFIDASVSSFTYLDAFEHKFFFFFFVIQYLLQL